MASTAEKIVEKGVREKKGKAPFLQLTPEERDKYALIFGRKIADFQARINRRMQEVKEDRRIYRQQEIPVDFPWRGASCFEHPIINAAVDDTARRVERAIADYHPMVWIGPPLTVEKKGDDLRVAANEVQEFVQALNTADWGPRLREKLHRSMRLACRDGVAWLMTYWRKEMGYFYAPEKGRVTEDIRTDAPQMDVVKIENTFWEPWDACSPEECTAIGHRAIRTIADLKKDEWHETDNPDGYLFDIDKIAVRDDPAWGDVGMGRMNAYVEIYQVVSSHFVDKVWRDCLWIIALHSTPQPTSIYAGDEGDPVAISGAAQLIGAMPLNLAHGQRPYSPLIYNPDPDAPMTNISVPRILRQVQKQMSIGWRQGEDQRTLANRRPWVMSQQALRNNPNLAQIGPGTAIIGRKGVDFDLLDVQSATPDLQVVESLGKLWGDRLVGTSDERQGTPETNTTATQATLAFRSASLVSDQQIWNVQNFTMLRLIRQELALCHQYLQAKVSFFSERVGGVKTIDAKKCLQYWRKYDLRPGGQQAQVDFERRNMQMMQIFGMLVKIDPFISPSLPSEEAIRVACSGNSAFYDNIRRELLTFSDYRDTDRLITSRSDFMERIHQLRKDGLEQLKRGQAKGLIIYEDPEADGKDDVYKEYIKWVKEQFAQPKALPAGAPVPELSHHDHEFIDEMIAEGKAPPAAGMEGPAPAPSPNEIPPISAQGALQA